MKRTVKFGLVAAGSVALALPLAACGSNTDPVQATNQNVTQQYEQAATQNGRRYPLKQMEQGGWTEEQLITEHLLRENDPNATRWVVFLNVYLQPIAEWPIKGMVFDPNSSIAETQDIACTNPGSTYECGVVQSPSDNGTYGPEAGAAAFFTTSNIEIQVPQGIDWIESDAPLTLTTKPVITYAVNATPSTNFNGLNKIGGK